MTAANEPSEQAKAEMPRQNKSIFIWLKIRGRHRDLQLFKLQSVLIRAFLHLLKKYLYKEIKSKF